MSDIYKRLVKTVESNYSKEYHERYMSAGVRTWMRELCLIMDEELAVLKERMGRENALRDVRVNEQAGL